MEVNVAKAIKKGTIYLLAVTIPLLCVQHNRSNSLLAYMAFLSAMIFRPFRY